MSQVSTWKIVLLAGSRNWQDYDMIAEIIGALKERYSTVLLILEGGCPTGADKMVRDVCRLRNIPNITMHAHWIHGKGAGPCRNRWMAALQPKESHLFFQTPKSRGTMNMYKACQEYRIPVIRYGPP